MDSDEPRTDITEQYYYDLIEKGEMARQWYFFHKFDGLIDWTCWDFYLGRVFGKVCFNIYTPFFSCGYAWS